MRKRTWVLLLTSIALLVGYTFAAAFRPSRGETLKAEVELALPKGTSRKKVESWFKAKGYSFNHRWMDGREGPVGLGVEIYGGGHWFGEKWYRIEVQWDECEKVDEVAVIVRNVSM
jgi:hypothetical protein